MANGTTITIDQFKNILGRVEKLEHKYEEIPVDIHKDINELKEDYHTVKKDIAVSDTKIDSFRMEFHTEIKLVRIEIKSLEK
ncbi:MAG: hypothetical protein CVT90_00455 [Candidatus Altiarchaeales archaeon HGW-Altiarchaeales-3]|nr:MAG: hypothetical protein CVT90_00455 [Candidatus Altiarchaeales archaeon HGW-Altiarchaeales-3]